MMTMTTVETGRRRAGWVGYAAAGWAAAYATVALVWTVTGAGFPFGQGNPDSFGPLRDLPVGPGAPLFAAVLGTTAVLALVMAGGSRPNRLLRRVLLGYGWLVAAALLVVVPEPDVLIVVAYAPLLVAGAPFGWPPVDYAEVFDWPLANHAFSIVGGLLVAATVLTWQRRTRDACERCGRGSALAGRAIPAARWGRWAVWVAVAVPLSYATIRIAWALRIPLTINDAFLDELHRTGMVWAGLWLGSFATIGAALTLGLVQRWGERFPRWMVGLAGRRVPVTLAVVPAGLVSALITSAGLAAISHPEVFGEVGSGDWVHLPALLWPAWGAALGAATLAYYLRRRGPCRRCGRSG
jgi:hypothetical protein